MTVKEQKIKDYFASKKLDLTKVYACSEGYSLIVDTDVDKGYNEAEFIINEKAELVDYSTRSSDKSGSVFIEQAIMFNCFVNKILEVLQKSELKEVLV